MTEVKSKRKFIIISHGRTGSTALMNWLNNLESVRCHGEIFMRNDYEDPDGFWHFCKQNSLRNFAYNSFLNPRYARYGINSMQNHLISHYLESLTNNAKHSGPWMTLEDRGLFIKNHKFNHEKTVGFKLAFGALRGYAGVRKWIKDNDTKIIYLTRNNRVKKMISWEMASQTNLFHSQNKTNNNTKISIESNDFLSRLYADKKLSESIEEIISGFSKPVLNISYEDLFMENSKQACDQLTTFLDIDENMYDKSNLSYTKKVNHDKIENIITNYSELYDKLKPTEFSKHLEEG